MLKKLGLFWILGIFFLVGYAQANSRNVELVKASETFATANKVAIVVGVNHYDSQSGLRSLDYAVPDAYHIKGALKKHNYVVRLLEGQQANKDFILDAIDKAGQLLDSKEGTLVFFFSGHGFSEPKSHMNYLATSNTLSSNLTGTALSLKDVEQAIRDTGVKRAVMFIDACRDNPFIGKSLGQPTFLQQHGQGIKALYSTSFGGLSYETPKLGHGVFTHFLHKGLLGEAIESDGIVSYESLKRFVQDKTANWTFENLGRVQKPFSRDKSDSFGIIVLGSIGGLNLEEPGQSSESISKFPYSPEISFHGVQGIPSSRKNYSITLKIYHNPNDEALVKERVGSWRKKGFDSVDFTYRPPDSMSKFHHWYLVVGKEFSTLEEAFVFYRNMRDKADEIDDFSGAYISESCLDDGSVPSCSGN